MKLRVFKTIDSLKAKPFFIVGCLSFICHFLSVTTVSANEKSASESKPELTSEKQSALLHLIKQDCGSCHGMRLTGGLGPDLTSSRMRQLGEKNISTVIKYGRPGTAMPPWRAILNDDEIAFISEQLVRGVQ